MTEQTPVVFIHGLWIHSKAWQNWVTLYEKSGYAATAPGWPGDGASVPSTRSNPTAVADKGINDIYDTYAAYIRTLPQKPIVVGHSFGGLVAQKLLADGLAVAAVAIDPAPIKGVKKVPLSQIRTAIPVVSKKANKTRSVSLTERQFRYGFGNALSKQESRDLFQQFAIPGPGKPLFEVTSAAKDPKSPAAVNTAKADRGPLLIIGGGKDHTVPQIVAEQAFGLYASSAAITDLEVFPDRGHSLVFDSRWAEVAQTTLRWLKRQGL
ncbi:alpha/beta fold hydrolase [Conyzicola nivalis]|uniref:Alpha/beta hydrolase n=1 Tax=Conyzicola nivalis TaxID=1477021 RepID=A0A916S9W0_9MICO|nr:alpha/beta hydrolase [Conyzicola nivalis]GGA90801.1 alpha/beta hydrolase [Conyzicola nivalis]